MIGSVVFMTKAYVYSSRSKINRLNVLGEPLASCCFDPITGYFRNGFCHAAVSDLGQHTVCAEMTSEFLSYSQKVGNDLTTPLPEVDFLG